MFFSSATTSDNQEIWVCRLALARDPATKLRNSLHRCDVIFVLHIYIILICSFKQIFLHINLNTSSIKQGQVSLLF